jgi:hypothetical protein
MGRTKKLLCAVAVCATAVVGVGASAAYAGEVKGPPGDSTNLIPGGNPNKTGAVGTANSACAASGLNDFDSGALLPPGTPNQNVSQVQTAADSWKYYGLPKGAPGTLGLCKGGAGEG